jgi:hypothetical protein
MPKCSTLVRANLRDIAQLVLKLTPLPNFR